MRGREILRFAQNGAAIHLHPEAARRRIREAARRAVERRGQIPRFWMAPPYELIRIERRRESGQPSHRWRQVGDDLIAVLQQPAARIEPE